MWSSKTTFQARSTENCIIVHSVLLVLGFQNIPIVFQWFLRFFCFIEIHEENDKSTPHINIWTQQTKEKYPDRKQKNIIVFSGCLFLLITKVRYDFFWILQSNHTLGWFKIVGINTLYLKVWPYSNQKPSWSWLRLDYMVMGHWVKNHCHEDGHIGFHRYQPIRFYSHVRKGWTLSSESHGQTKRCRSFQWTLPCFTTLSGDSWFDTMASRCYLFVPQISGPDKSGNGIGPPQLSIWSCTMSYLH